MRVAITLILVILAMTLANVCAAMATSNSWSSLAHVITCFVNSVIIAGVITTCPLRSSWLAFLVTTAVFLLLAMTESAALDNVMQHIAKVFESWKLRPPLNSETDNQSVERLAAALAISCPPFFGVAAGLIAIVFFPGYRQSRSWDNDYK